MQSNRFALIEHIQHCAFVGVPERLIREALVLASDHTNVDNERFAFTELVNRKMEGYFTQFKELRGLTISPISWSPRLVSGDIRELASRSEYRPDRQPVPIMIILLDCLLEYDDSCLGPVINAIHSWLPPLVVSRANCLALNSPFWKPIVLDLQGLPHFVQLHETEHQIESIANELLDKGKWSEAPRILGPLMGLE